MAHTAEHEAHGSSHVEVISANATAPLPSRPGGARLLVYQATVGSLSVTLPDARQLQPGGRLHYLICSDNGSTPNTFDIKSSGGATVHAALAANECAELYLTSNTTAAGTWAKRVTAFAEGTYVASDRQPLTYRFDGALTNFNLAAYAFAHGWDGVSKAALRVTLGPDCLIGASSTSSIAFSSGTFPNGSSLLLVLEPGAYISGAGGHGGSGGWVPPGLTAQNGSAGGVALYVSVTNTRIVNEGTIQGGGGGGGGGRYSGSQPGGGGGGGAGYANSLGGAPGGNGTGATYGVGGTLTWAGGGGAGGNPGGTGGLAGAPGSNGNAFGGAAGDAIQRLAGMLSYNVTGSGLIHGAQVVVS